MHGCRTWPQSYPQKLCESGKPGLPINWACISFLIGIKYLSPVRQACTHCFPQFLCTADRLASRPGFAWLRRRCPKKLQRRFFLTNQGHLSSPRLLLTIFSTKYVKKNVAPIRSDAGETIGAGSRDGSERLSSFPHRAGSNYTPGRPGPGTAASRSACLKIRLERESPIESRACLARARLAHIVFHSLCAHSRSLYSRE